MALPEYLSYWGLEKPPFSLAPDPAMLYPSQQHRECLMRLKYSIYGNKGGALLISENAGDGKTSLLLKLAEDLKSELEGKVRVAFIDHPTVTSSQMVGEIARRFGVDQVAIDKVRNLNMLRQHLEELHGDGFKAIAIVDEGQMLCHRPDILQELRILLNFCVADAFLLTFIFSGQKPLEAAVREMPEFWQRLPVRFFLKNLNLPDTRELIRHRLRVAGLEDREVFTETAYEGIFRFSEGCPRVICSVADLALLIGYSTYAKRIDFAEISQACTDMNKSGDAYHYFHFLNAPTEKRDGEDEQKIRKAESPNKQDSSSQNSKVPNKKPAAAKELKCPRCQFPAEEGSRYCRECGGPMALPCPKCLHQNPTGRKSCERCGIDLDSSRERQLNKDFLSGLKKLRRSKKSLAKKQSWARRFKLQGEEGLVLILPRGHFGRHPVAVKMPFDNTKPDSTSCGLVVGETALLLLLKKETLEIPYKSIQEFKVNRGSRVSSHQVDILVEGNCYQLSFPFLQEEALAFARLLEGYVRGKVC